MSPALVLTALARNPANKKTLPWNEFLIPVLSGYAFVHLFYLTKFHAQRYDGYRLLIESTFVGVVLFLLSRIAMIWFHRTPIGASLERWLLGVGIGYPFFGTGACALCLAVILPVIGNAIIGRDRAKSILVSRDDNGFLGLFHRALTEARMVSVTLASRKTYIGYITRTPNLSPGQQFVGLLPLLSGYRDKDTMRLTVTTNYAKVVASQEYNPDDFEITFSLDAISTANLFEPNAYPLFGDLATPSTETPSGQENFGLQLPPSQQPSETPDPKQ
jgi:hypothetical protein